MAGEAAVTTARHSVAHPAKPVKETVRRTRPMTPVFSESRTTPAARPRRGGHWRRWLGPRHSTTAPTAWPRRPVVKPMRSTTETSVCSSGRRSDTGAVPSTGLTNFAMLTPDVKWRRRNRSKRHLVHRRIGDHGQPCGRRRRVRRRRCPGNRSLNSVCKKLCSRPNAAGSATNPAP